MFSFSHGHNRAHVWHPATTRLLAYACTGKQPERAGSCFALSHQGQKQGFGNALTGILGENPFLASFRIPSINVT